MNLFFTVALAILATYDTVRAGCLSTANSNVRRSLTGKPVRGIWATSWTPSSCLGYQCIQFDNVKRVRVAVSVV
ncbi:hypothetical protein FIBSPDRAFT_949460 [Athelia psychrophila]|uniref:Secreted protein n=1 Tax=Athelia psychrophila TaxID=1759441 RepID=A0A166PNP4_9AGAM|nr:hypothetical protein FIBSPDRAFT_949460 [Fibularhizoctonia sp. CBS 109695]